MSTKRRHVLRHLIPSVMVVAVLGGVVPLGAQESIEEARQRRAEIQAEQAEAAERIDVLQAEDAELVDALRKLDEWIDAENARLEAVEQDLAATLEAETEARNRAANLSGQIDDLADAVAQQSVDSYIAGFDSSDTLLLNSVDINAVPVLRYLIDESSGTTADTTDLLRAARQLQMDAVAEAEAAAERARALRADIEERRDGLRGDRARQRELRAEVNDRIDRLEEVTRALEEEDQNVAEFIRAEQARIEAERLEAERLEAERLEQERLEAERLEQERLEQEQQEQENGGSDDTSGDTGGDGSDDGTDDGSGGTDSPPPSGDAPAFVYPVSGAITSPFGNRVHPVYGTVRFHAGVDFNAPSGAPIVAAASGTVIFAGEFGGYGNAVIVDHGGGYTSLYGHMSGFNTSQGASVSAGTTIGFVGSTGLSTGPHLHFEIRINGTAVDPVPYL